MNLRVFIGKNYCLVLMYVSAFFYNDLDDFSCQTLVHELFGASLMFVIYS